MSDFKEVQIFYESNGQKQGPIKIKDLKPSQLSKDTLVWKNGLSDWVRASKLEDLKDYFYSQENYLKNVPPPLPSKNKVVLNETYNTEGSITWFLLLLGIGFMIINVSLAVHINTKIDSYYVHSMYFDIEEWKNKMVILVSIVAVLERFLGMFFCNSESREKNRDTVFWTVFGLLLPSFALAIIGAAWKKK